MSDSESSVQVQEKHELQNEAKVRELIQKAKQLLPDYNEESLVNLYKTSYQSEIVFLNKIDVIKRQKNQAEEGGEWIESNRRGEREVRQFRNVQVQPVERRERYNFLEDKKLIDRALKFKPFENRRKNDYYEQQDTRKPVNYRQKEQGQNSYKAPRGDEKKVNNNKSFQEKKVNYKEKVENGEKVSQNQTTSKVQTEVKKSVVQQSKPAKAYQQKPKEFVEKKVAVQQSKEVVAESVVKKEQKVVAPEPVKVVEAPVVKEQPKKVEAPVAKEQPKKVEAPVLKQEPKKVETPIIKEQPKKVETLIPKQEPKKIEAPAKAEVKQVKKFVQKPVQVKPAQPVQAVQAAQQPSMKLIPEQKKVQQKLAATTTQSTKVISSTTKLSSDKQLEKLSAEAREEFSNSLAQNSFILKYILPVPGRIQKVSYLRYPDGTLRNIQARQLLPYKD